MKNPFKKNPTTDPIDTSLKVIRNTAIKSGITCAINAIATVATPVAIKVVSKDIEDNSAKNVIYGTGAVLCAYQLTETIRQFGKTRAIVSAYKMMKGYEAEDIENEAKALLEAETLVNDLSTEMEEIINEQERKE